MGPCGSGSALGVGGLLSALCRPAEFMQGQWLRSLPPSSASPAGPGAPSVAGSRTMGPGCAIPCYLLSISPHPGAGLVWGNRTQAPLTAFTEPLTPDPGSPPCPSQLLRSRVCSSQPLSPCGCRGPSLVGTVRGPCSLARAGSLSELSLLHPKPPALSFGNLLMACEKWVAKFPHPISMGGGAELPVFSSCTLGSPWSSVREAPGENTWTGRSGWLLRPV